MLAQVRELSKPGSQAPLCLMVIPYIEQEGQSCSKSRHGWFVCQTLCHLPSMSPQATVPRFLLLYIKGLLPLNPADGTSLPSVPLVAASTSWFLLIWDLRQWKIFLPHIPTSSRQKRGTHCLVQNIAPNNLIYLPWQHPNLASKSVLVRYCHHHNKDSIVASNFQKSQGFLSVCFLSFQRYQVIVPQFSWLQRLKLGRFHVEKNCVQHVLRRKNVGLLSDLQEVRHGMYQEASFREEDGVGMISSSCLHSESSAQELKSCTRIRGFSSGMASPCLRKGYSSQPGSWLLVGISSVH